MNCVMNKYVLPDTIWESVWEIRNHEEYLKRMVPQFQLRKEVSEDIKKEFEIIEHLCALSYFRYQLYDEAVRKALLIFEMALKIRHREIYEKDFKGNLEELINKLHKKNIFDSSLNFLHHTRLVRNSQVHRDRHSFGGPALRHWLESITMVINETYDSIEQRVVRVKLLEKVNNTVNTFFGECVSIRVDDADYFLSDTIIPIFVNNRCEECVYSFYVVPTFDLSIYENGGLYTTPFLEINIKNLQIDNEKKVISGISDNTSKKIVIEFNVEPPLRQLFFGWKNKFESLPHKDVIKHLMMMEMNKCYNSVKYSYLLNS